MWEVRINGKLPALMVTTSHHAALNFIKTICPVSFDVQNEWQKDRIYGCHSKLIVMGAIVFWFEIIFTGE